MRGRERSGGVGVGVGGGGGKVRGVGVGGGVGGGDLRRRIGMGSLEEDIVEISNLRREILRVCRPSPAKKRRSSAGGDEENGCI